MFASLAIIGLLAFSVLVNADPSPNTPGPGAVYNAGAQCPIAWAVDTTGIWKTMNIQLMTGDNFNMVALTTVTTVDGTNPSTDTFSWTCPEVNPNSAIYFYQFTSPASNDTLWTTRFAIASDSGATTPPAKATQPNGQAIPWGTGQLVNAASANPPPTGGATSATLTGTVLTATSSVSSVSSASSAPTTASSSVIAISSSPGGVTPEATPGTSNSIPGTTTGSASGASSSVGSNTANANTAMANLSVDGRIFQAMIALGVAALGITAVL